jgi:GTP:adenosylcobinamide-phosphate guanylyltransferase
MGHAGQVTALIVAGRRPGIDPLAAHFGVDDKALIAVAGQPMLGRVAATLLAHPAVARVVVLAQEPERLVAALPALAADPRLATRAGGDSVSDAVAGAIAGDPGGFPFLLVTADHPLLDAAMIDAFLAGAAGSDLAVGLVERRVLIAAYPGSRRTWLRFRGGAWSGANLFWLGNPRVAPILARWRAIEQQRKRARAVIGAFGPLLLLGSVLRLLTIDQAIVRAGRRFGLAARAVALPFAEACIDVDKPADHAQVEAIIRARGLS